ncbi:unnamed protein product [Symbiodinium natans]|uniref:Uncharacterized protein n=1 Tax=Symbiodinium natans TaxID=878477 RepID=A0A812RKL3_9DINO|nr:unnamed protein product [Symbiodinium natans]
MTFWVYLETLARAASAAGPAHGPEVQFRMKNLDSMQTRLLAEISGLPEDKRAEGFSKILDALPRILPRPALQQLADRLAADGVVSGNGAATEQPAEEPAGAAGGEEETTAHDMMEDFLQNVESTSSIADYGKLWAQLGVPRESEVEVLSALLEVSVQKTTTFDLVPRVVAELARTRKVLVTSLEAALKDLARKLEDIVQANDQAWHLISYFLVYLFPRTRSSEWGFHFGGWNFPSWWKATEDILKEAHKWRAFDILVLSLSGWSCGPLVLWSSGPLELRSSGPLVPWFAGPLVLWSRGPLVLWSRGPLVLWSFGPAVLWSSGPVILWSCGLLVLRASGNRYLHETTIETLYL